MTEKEGHSKSYATDSVHHAQDPEQWDSLAVVPPIYLSSIYKQKESPDSKDYIYTRWGNPTRDVLEKVMAKLDNAKYGLAFSSGMGAATTVLGLLRSGDHLICSDALYGGTTSLFDNVATNFGIEVSTIDFADVSKLESYIKKNTKLIWVESPTNPTMKVLDLKAIGIISKKHGITFVVDNTFLTSYNIRPLEFGVDIVSYSISKYVNGHADVIMGALVTSNKEIYDKLKFLQMIMGIVPSTFDCYQVARSIKTLSLRMQQHSKNALTLAKYLESHPKVEKVLHPGLPSHPQHELFRSQTSGNSGTFSFYIKGTIETAKTFMRSLKIFCDAGSLGGCESLVELPVLISHVDVPLESRLKLGITDNLIRLSVGIEDPEDLVADVEQALKKA